MDDTKGRLFAWSFFAGFAFCAFIVVTCFGVAALPVAGAWNSTGDLLTYAWTIITVAWLCAIRSLVLQIEREFT